MCLNRVNEWVLEFNSRTKKLLIDLNKRLPGAKFSFADTYPAVLDLINNPTHYGKKRELINIQTLHNCICVTGLYIVTYHNVSKTYTI